MAPWTRSTWADAGQLLAVVDPDALHADADGKALADWFAGAVQKRDIVGALFFLAHALPRYECVVWAARCLIEGGGAARSEPAMIAILRWIDDPDDELRRAAGDAAGDIAGTTPTKLLGQAIFLSGGSLAPKDLPPVQPPSDVCAKLAGAAVLLGAHRTANSDAALLQALAIGEAIVSGTGDIAATDS
jgi:uncharacterized protein DUF6931